VRKEREREEKEAQASHSLLFFGSKQSENQN